MKEKLDFNIHSNFSHSRNQNIPGSNPDNAVSWDLRLPVTFKLVTAQ